MPLPFKRAKIMRAIAKDNLTRGEYFIAEVTVSEVFTHDSVGFCVRCGRNQLHCEPETAHKMCKLCFHPQVYGMEALAGRGMLIVKREE